jgi:hypothetical protein
MACQVLIGTVFPDQFVEVFQLVDVLPVQMRVDAGNEITAPERLTFSISQLVTTVRVPVYVETLYPAFKRTFILVSARVPDAGIRVKLEEYVDVVDISK